MYTPDTEISLKDFIEKAKEEGCTVFKNKKGTFIGGNKSKITYPHIHIWVDDTIALSVGKTKNEKVGEDGVIDISKLNIVSGRFNVMAGSLNNTIRWVMSSAS